jgi:hypothetical protein
MLKFNKDNYNINTCAEKYYKSYLSKRPKLCQEIYPDRVKKNNFMIIIKIYFEIKMRSSKICSEQR